MKKKQFKSNIQYPDAITTQDLLFINDLSNRTYSGNTMLSNATEKEREQFHFVKRKLKNIADYFSKKYNQSYGPFETSVTSGNPMVIGGTNLNRLWSGIFKGAPNKQYAAQISFVMNPHETCLDVGFYFGRASAHKLDKIERLKLEAQLNKLGLAVANAIESDVQLKSKFELLFDFGFKAYSQGVSVLADVWCEIIKKDPKNNYIISKIFPNDFGTIENSILDAYVSQIIFLIGAISDSASSKLMKVMPKTPEQLAIEAFRRAEIGQKGERYIMDYEESRLKKLGLHKNGYPAHKALESTNYGYDILSLDNNGDEIFIEVKTTTRSIEEKDSRKFYMSTNEYKIYTNNKKQYKLYRVYDVENNPQFDSVDLENVRKNPDGYIINY